MGPVARMMRALAPRLALKREVARAQFDLLRSRRDEMAGRSYAPTGGGARSKEFRKNRHDAQEALRYERGPLAQIARDMLRNNPRVVRGTSLFANTVVGKGIQPVVEMVSGEDDGDKSRIEGLIRDHLLTSAIDADGHGNLFALQALAMQAVPTSGEVLVRQRLRRAGDGLPLPFQVQLLETDFLAQEGLGVRAAGNNRVDEGVEYDALGRAVAYHLHNVHPGSRWGSTSVRRVAAENIVLMFNPNRPGQRRGVSWFAPVMGELLDLQKFMGATLKKQEMAAMFAGIMTSDRDESYDDNLAEISAGSIYEIGSGETLTFNDPPKSDSADPVVRMMDRVIAAALMLSYEAFSGDYSGVNYSGGRMARMDQDPSVQRWQHHMMIGQMCERITGWFKEAVYLTTFIEPDKYRLTWTPPQRPVVDPTKDWPALNAKWRGGLTSRRQVMREHGMDPAQVEAEILAEQQWARENGLDFSGKGEAKSEDSNDDN